MRQAVPARSYAPVMTSPWRPGNAGLVRRNRSTPVRRSRAEVIFSSGWDPGRAGVVGPRSVRYGSKNVLDPPSRESRRRSGEEADTLIMSLLGGSIYGESPDSDRMGDHSRLPRKLRTTSSPSAVASTEEGYEQHGQPRDHPGASRTTPPAATVSSRDAICNNRKRLIMPSSSGTLSSVQITPATKPFGPKATRWGGQNPL